MSQYRLEVRIKPRPGLLDPQGKAIHHSLNSLGWDGVQDVRVGKAIYIDIDSDSEAAAMEAAEAMCRKLLANPVTEDYEVAMVGKLEGSGA
ncbi:MAG: phosphoribosylformylglycinamidine synthase subunit PurS [Longimicrobiales bacterium]|nr:phosphoribosylformylglycinamidine synthase subunit PurS [Longimicrobiales bacterium]